MILFLLSLMFSIVFTLLIGIAYLLLREFIAYQNLMKSIQKTKEIFHTLFSNHP